MDDSVDHGGDALFTEDFQHTSLVYMDFDGHKSIDVIKTNGNMWLPATQVMEVMGMSAKETKNTSRVSDRIDHPDIIKIRDTSFRFTDGRRNRGSLISPRAIMVFNSGRTKGFNHIKANAFVAWMEEELLNEGDVETWSPKRIAPTYLEPVFRQIITVTDESKYGEALDPLRPTDIYHGLGHLGPLQEDEMEFPFEGFGMWSSPRRIEIEDGLVIDDDDDFSLIAA